MTLPVLPIAPSTLRPIVFAAEMDAHLAALGPWSLALDALASQAQAAANTATTQAEITTTQAEITTTQAGLATAAANFKGNWSSLTGPLALPASVAHLDSFWALNTALSNVTLAVPGVSASWTKVKSGDVSLAEVQTLTNKRISAFYIADKTTTNDVATGALTFDVSIASVFNLTLTGGVTGITITNAPTLTQETLSFVVRVKQGATAYALTWFSGVVWLTIGGTAPAAPSANKTTEYIFTSTSAGAYIGRKGSAT